MKFLTQRLSVLSALIATSPLALAEETTEALASSSFDMAPFALISVGLIALITVRSYVNKSA